MQVIFTMSDYFKVKIKELRYNNNQWEAKCSYCNDAQIYNWTPVYFPKGFSIKPQINDIVLMHKTMLESNRYCYYYNSSKVAIEDYAIGDTINDKYLYINNNILSTKKLDKLQLQINNINIIDQINKIIDNINSALLKTKAALIPLGVAIDYTPETQQLNTIKQNLQDINYEN